MRLNFLQHFGKALRLNRKEHKFAVFNDFTFVIRLLNTQRIDILMLFGVTVAEHYLLGSDDVILQNSAENGGSHIAYSDSTKFEHQKRLLSVIPM